MEVLNINNVVTRELKPINILELPVAETSEVQKVPEKKLQELYYEYFSTKKTDFNALVLGLRWPIIGSEEELTPEQAENVAQLMCMILELFVATRSDIKAQSLIQEYLVDRKFPINADAAFVKSYIPTILNFIFRGTLDLPPEKYKDFYRDKLLELKWFVQDKSIPEPTADQIQTFMNFFSIVDYRNDLGKISQQ